MAPRVEALIPSVWVRASPSSVRCLAAAAAVVGTADHVPHASRQSPPDPPPPSDSAAPTPARTPRPSGYPVR